MRAVFWIALSLCASLAASPPSAADLQNPDFETGTPGPGVATFWASYAVYGTASYQIMHSPPDSWAVMSGAQSQLWGNATPTLTETGIYQVVTGITPGTYQASIYFREPMPPYLGPTTLRIGIEPTGKSPTAPGAAIAWGPPLPVTASWQLASVELALTGANATVVVAASSMGPNPSGAVVDFGGLVKTYNKVAGVPDEVYPPNDPLGTGDITNWCGPIAATNITEYYANNGTAPGVNDALDRKNIPGYIGWWMDTNNDGCPLRCNGALPNYNPPMGSSGTYMADIAPGLAEYTQWDANHLFCCGPPNLPAGKLTYSWTVKTYLNGFGGVNINSLWNQLKVEIDAGRPLLASWAHWCLIDTNININGIEFYTWDPNPQNSNNNKDHPEEWGDWTHPTAGDTGIGHITTAVGYWRKDHDNDGTADNWVIVHDTWADTAVDVAVTTSGACPWMANTTVNTAAPVVGAVTVTKPGTSPANHWGRANKQNAMLQMRFQETSNNESVRIDAVTLTAAGTGHDKDDIVSVDLYDDLGNKGKFDAGVDTLLASGTYPADNGTLKIYLPGNQFVVPQNGVRDMLVVYSMGNTASHGETFGLSVDSICATGFASYVPIAPNIPFAISSCTKTFSTLVVSNPWPCPCVACWKQWKDGTYGWWHGCSPWVSAGYGAFEKKIYIQDDPRTSTDGPAGIQVYFGDEPIPTGLHEGATAEFAAYIDTNANGERVLVQPEGLSFFDLAPGDEPKPVGMAPRSLGGGHFHWPEGGGGGGAGGQMGVREGYGLNNIGLLVRVAGSVVEIDSSENKWFKIEDGSRYSTGESRTVKVVKRPEMPIGYPARGQFVGVTGICSVETVGPITVPVVMMRDLDDMRIAGP